MRPRIAGGDFEGRGTGGRPAAKAGIERGSRQFRLVSLALFAAGFSAFALLYFVQPLLPVFAADFHVSPASSSLVMSATTETLAFALLLSGAVSDILGRKPIMVFSMVASALLTILTAFAPSWGWLVASRVLIGISLSGIQGVGMAYLAEEMHPRSFGLALGLFIGGGVVGGLFGRTAVSIAADFVSWRIATACLGVIALASALALWRLLPASRNFGGRRGGVGLPRAFATHLSNGRLLLLFSVGFLLMGGFVAVFNYVAFRLVAPPLSLSQALVGTVFVVNLSGTVSSAWTGNLVARHGHGKVLCAMVVIALVGLALTVPPSLASIVFGLMVFTFGFFACHSVASGWVSQTASTNRALAASLYLFFYYQGSSIAGWTGGVFFAHFGWHGVVAMTGMMFAAALFVAGVLKRRSVPV